MLVYEDPDGAGASALSLDARVLHGPNVDQVLAHEDSTGDVLWALSDNLGSVHDVVNYASGTDTTSVDDHIIYGAFGNEISHTGSTEFLFGFTGRERDVESDLQYNRARYYDTELGQWVSEDPIGFLGGDPNLRRYVNNQSVYSVDPSGLEENEDDPQVHSVFQPISSLPPVIRARIQVHPVSVPNENDYPFSNIDYEIYRRLGVSDPRLRRTEADPKERIEIVIQTFIPAAMITAPTGEKFKGDTRTGPDPTPERADNDYRMRFYGKYYLGNGTLKTETDAGLTVEYDRSGKEIIGLFEGQEGAHMKHNAFTWKREAGTYLRVVGEGTDALAFGPTPAIDYAFTILIDENHKMVNIHTGRHDGYPSYEIQARYNDGDWKLVYFHDALAEKQTLYSLFGRGEYRIHDKPSIRLDYKAADGDATK